MISDFFWPTIPDKTPRSLARIPKEYPSTRKVPLKPLYVAPKHVAYKATLFSNVCK
jgi:hypothetical protein